VIGLLGVGLPRIDWRFLGVVRPSRDASVTDDSPRKVLNEIRGRRFPPRPYATQVLTPDELRDHLVELRIMGAEEINIMMMQCYSGHFIDLTNAMLGRTTKDSVTAIATAANNSEVSYGKSFGWEFVAALAKAYPNGTVVDADADHNGEVTWNEGFVYALNHDKYGPKGAGDEHPQYFSNARWLDPDGDGVHSNYDDKPHTYNPDQ